jgi:hypothetical protein
LASSLPAAMGFAEVQRLEIVECGASSVAERGGKVTLAARSECPPCAAHYQSFGYGNSQAFLGTPDFADFRSSFGTLISLVACRLAALGIHEHVIGISAQVYADHQCPILYGELCGISKPYDDVLRLAPS